MSKWVIARTNKVTSSNWGINLAAAVLGSVFLTHCGGTEPSDATQMGASAEEALGTQVRRPSNVPEDYVPTPVGWRHRSCVVSLGADETLAEDHIRKADGTKRQLTQCAHLAYDREGRAFDPATHSPQVNGWVASVSATSTGPINYLSANWTVPQTPAAATTQTLFYFPGVEPLATSDVILQPVLAWNGFGDKAWTIASWACCKYGNVYNSTPQNVASGDNLTGTVTGTSCGSGGVCANWSIVTKDSKNGKSTTFTTVGGGEAMDWVFGGAMEIYGVDTCTQYPKNTSTRFSNIKTRTTSGTLVLPAFSAWAAGSSVSPNCNATFGSPQNSGTTASWLLSWSNK